jgi:hypothetical protein
MTSDICEHGILLDACVPCIIAKWRAEDMKGGVMVPMKSKRLTGGSSDYYKVEVAKPTSGGIPYVAECNDIIEALNMEYDVANAFKAAWRVAALRQGRGKPGQDSAVYDGEKIVFFGKRIIERAK